MNRRHLLRRTEDRTDARAVNNLWSVAFLILLAVTAGGLYLNEQRELHRLERIADRGADLRYLADLRQCERVQILRGEVNDVIRANRRISRAGGAQVPPDSPLGREFRRLLATLEVQARVDCAIAVPGPTAATID